MSTDSNICHTSVFIIFFGAVSFAISNRLEPWPMRGRVVRRWAAASPWFATMVALPGRPARRRHTATTTMATSASRIVPAKMLARMMVSIRRYSSSSGASIAFDKAKNARAHPFNGPLSGTTRLSRYQKGKTKTNVDFTEARDSKWSGISWAICKSSPRSRQITTPAPHHSVFYRPGALPAAQPTASKH